VVQKYPVLNDQTLDPIHFYISAFQSRSYKFLNAIYFNLAVMGRGAPITNCVTNGVTVTWGGVITDGVISFCDPMFQEVDIGDFRHRQPPFKPADDRPPSRGCGRQYSRNHGEEARSLSKCPHVQ
jgi:hypothetical protein